MNNNCDMTSAVLTVGELNRLARTVIEKGMPSCWVRGEISNFSRAASGHWYFTLKDREAAVRCVMFKTANQHVDWTPREGEQVELRVQPSLYEPRGDYQALVDAMRKSGQGSLFDAFLKLKSKLAAESLFAQERKRLLPGYPKHIGIITSAQAAALRDVLTTLRARWPVCTVILYPTPVQGDESGHSIAKTILTAGDDGLCEILLLVRGGGGIEDLWGFNEEVVARSMAACPIPIITGIGHETDFTIADFVADLRAPTPTGAAQLATPALTDLLQHLFHLRSRLNQYHARHMSHLFQVIDGLRRRLIHPKEKIQYRRQQVALMHMRLRDAFQNLARRRDQHFREAHKRILPFKETLAFSRQLSAQLTTRLQFGFTASAAALREKVARFSAHLVLLNPTSVLQRGYSIVTDTEGKVIRDTDQLVLGQTIAVTLESGNFRGNVQEINPQWPR